MEQLTSYRAISALLGSLGRRTGKVVDYGVRLWAAWAPQNHGPVMWTVKMGQGLLSWDTADGVWSSACVPEQAPSPSYLESFRQDEK